MVESDGNTGLFSPRHLHDVTGEDMNLLFVKVTFDFFHITKEIPKKKKL